MQRYLLFDGGCTACTRVALQVEQLSNGWMRARSLSDPTMKVFLTKGRPNWKWEPTLIEIDGQNVTVFTGLPMSIRILAALGPRRAWQIAQHVREAEHVQSASRPFTSERRTFLKRMSLAIGAGLVPALGLPTPSLAAASVSSFRWERLPQAEAQAVVAAARISPLYQSFVSQLTQPFSIGSGAIIAGHGAHAFVAMPVTTGSKLNGSAFVALVDRAQRNVQQTLAWTIEDRGNQHHARVKLNGQVIVDATFDDTGTVVTGWVRGNNGEQQSIAGQNRVRDGQRALDELRRSTAQRGPGVGTQQSSFDCLNACLSNAGLPLYLLALIATICAIACAITVGFGCFACLSGLLGGLLGVGLRCLVNCGYAVP